MAIEFIILLIILAGFALSFKLRGQAARRARKWYAIALALILGGCLGSLSWLDAETSGNQNFAVSVNPFIWAGMFLVGVAVLFINSLQVFSARADQKAQQAQERTASESPDATNHDRPERD